jgi:hypothetical protein
MWIADCGLDCRLSIDESIADWAIGAGLLWRVQNADARMLTADCGGGRR